MKEVPRLQVREVASGGVRFAVRVQPRASRSEIVGVQGDALRVRLSAPPVAGAANAALIELLAAALAVPRAQIRVVAGASSRNKIVEVFGAGVDRIQALISPPAPLA
jgi:uncharacterized protein